jgi:EAL domain-containing protein (putative c-di-GMP-specific phosphodiesterase class I)/ActR/RegA family two-component response regulator
VYEDGWSMLVFCRMTAVAKEFTPRPTDSVLIVDPDIVTRTIASAAMRALGFTQIHTADSGANAVACSDGVSECPQILILTLTLPDMHGVDVIRKLAANRFSGALILVGGEDPTTLRAAEALGRALHLRVIGSHAKPLHRDRLAAMLSSYHDGAARFDGGLEREFTAGDLKRAIDEGEIIAHYQPQVLVDSGAVIGVEALARWQHPEAGLVRPDQFIPVVQSCGLIRDLTRCVLKSAIARVTRWRSCGIGLTVAVNVTMSDLEAPEFVSQAIELARAYNLDPESVMLEVTESQLIYDRVRVLDSLARLRIHRFRLSIDDFGTGHSSLVQLRDLPFDELKLDRSFTRDAHGDSHLRAFVQSSIDLARTLGMSAVAEGVESAADWEYVRTTGARCTQGYFIAKPMPGDAIPGWIARWNARVHDERLLGQARQGAAYASN